MLDIITDNLDVWTTAKKNKKAVGRGSSKKQDAYGIKKLRELILELAVRGKLVPQDAGDEPASILLDKALKAKNDLAKARKIRNSKESYKVTPLFEEPELWIWTNIG